MSKRVNAIQEVNESVSLLTQLLQDYDGSNQSNAELLQVRVNLGGSRKELCLITTPCNTILLI